jgi:hypothetical protein
MGLFTERMQKSHVDEKRVLDDEEQSPTGEAPATLSKVGNDEESRNEELEIKRCVLAVL